MSILSWPVVVLLCLFIGLAPHTQPHVVEKLALLLRGELVRAIDWFDLALHGTPWLLLAARATLSLRNFVRSTASHIGKRKRS